jgi:hypothetical protein
VVYKEDAGHATEIRFILCLQEHVCILKMAAVAASKSAAGAVKNQPNRPLSRPSAAVVESAHGNQLTSKILKIWSAAVYLVTREI